MELPSHPESDVELERERPSGGQPANKASLGQILVFGAIGALVLLMIVLHLLGVVGPGAQ